MSTIGLVLTAALSVVVGILFAAGPVAACSCALVTDEEAFEYSDAVFTGTLVEFITGAGDRYVSTDPARFVFEVDRVFKGDVFARQSIVTARDGGSCGLEISGRGPFVVFARSESSDFRGSAVEGELFSNLCSGTRALASGAVPVTFGEGSPPVPGSSPVGGNGSQVSIVWIAGIGGAVALVGAGCALAYVRSRRNTVSS